MRRLGFFGKKQRTFLPVSSLAGLVAPLVTPMEKDGTVDEFALKTLTARMMNKGVKNFFVLGPFSERDYLEPKERRKVLETVSNEVKGKALVIAGCFGSTAEEAVGMVKEAEEFSNICAVSVPELAMERELEFIDFFDSIFMQTKPSIVLYNNPSVSGKSVPALWLDNIINWERLLGVIDASRNPDYLDELGKYYQFTKLFEENELLAFDALRRNFSGVSCLSSLILPTYYSSLVDDFAEMDFWRVMRMESKVLSLNKLLVPEKRIQAAKYILYLQGVIKPFYSTQLAPLNDKEKAGIENIFHLKKAGAAQ